MNLHASIGLIFYTKTEKRKRNSIHGQNSHFTQPIAAKKENTRLRRETTRQKKPPTMAKKAIQRDQIVKLIVGAGQASPSPPVGPALGSKGVKSMDFCKVNPSPIHPTHPQFHSLFKPQEFNARTAHFTPGTPTPARVTVRPDRSFTFEIRTPPTATLLLAAAGAKPGKAGKLRGAGNTAGPRNNVEGASGKSGSGKSVEVRGNSATGTVGTVSLKHVYEIARIKQGEGRLGGVGLEGLCKTVVAQAGSIGVVVVP